MPIKGIVDPSHKQRKSATGGITGNLPKWYPVEELLDQAYHSDPKWSPWSFELLNAAIGSMEERGDNISTTALTGPCPRSTVLERKEEYIADVDKLWRAFRGTMVHYVLEDAARPNSIAEVRFHAPLADDEISCKPDLITQEGVMWDYKNVGNLPRYDSPFPSHVEQLQFNAYIVRNATKWALDDNDYELPFDVRGMDFKRLAILYMDIDGPKVLECQTSIQVPNKTRPGTHAVKVPDVWSDDQVLELMWPRFKSLREALDSYPKWPKGLEEFWGGDAGWECPGFPHCPLKGNCLASRYPKGLVW